jgi:hypothetical protein
MTDDKICPLMSQVVIGDIFEDSPEPGLGGHYNKGTVFLSQICLKEQCAAWGIVGFKGPLDIAPLEKQCPKVPRYGCKLIE